MNEKQTDESSAKVPEECIVPDWRLIRELNDCETVFASVSALVADTDRTCYLISDEITFPTPSRNSMRIDKSGNAYNVVLPFRAEVRLQQIPDAFRSSLIPVGSIRVGPI